MQALSRCNKRKNLDNKEAKLAKNDEHAVLIFIRSRAQTVSFSGLCENPYGGISQNADLRSDQLSTKELTVLPTVTKQALPNKEMNPYTLLQYKRYDM
jgi:hypothetical protein